MPRRTRDHHTRQRPVERGPRHELRSLTTPSPDNDRDAAGTTPPLDGLGFAHTTVLRDETVAAVAGSPLWQSAATLDEPQASPLWVVDCTLGGGGHSEALLERLPAVRVLGLDRDPAALATAAARLARFGERFACEHAAFGDLSAVVARRQLGPLAGVVADLGVSSHQFDTAQRGFSLRLDGPLDMRMDPTRGPTAAALLARVRLEDLADILYAFGDITRSIGTARIVLEEFNRGADTTLTLANRLAARLGNPRGKGIHPATQVFQALRIWVNGELDQLASLLDHGPQLLAEGAALAVISFHSGEDRLVKQHFSRLARRGGGYTLPHRKPLVASAAETAANPRARSAKLRVLVRQTAGEPWRGQDEQAGDEDDE